MCFSRNYRNSESHGSTYSSHVQKRISILTWNIEGHKTLNSDDGNVNKFNAVHIKKMFSKHEIICLSETWTNIDTECNICLQGYEPFCQSRSGKHVKSNRESGGLAILVKNSILKFVQRQPSTSENTIWLKIYKDLCNTTKDIYLGSVYLPPEYSSYNRNNLSNYWDNIEKEMSFFKAKGFVMLCGDLNSRSSTLQDYIPDDSREDFLSLPCNYIPDRSDIPIRCNLDETINNYGKKIIEFCIGQRLHIINGRTKGDYFGNFTCLKYNGCSTVDYNIISKELSHLPDSFTVLPLTEFSDHKPLSLVLNVHYHEEDVITDDILTTDAPGKFVFNAYSKTKFVNTLLLPETRQRIDTFVNHVYSYSQQDINEAVTDFTNIVKSAAKVSTRFVKVKPRKKLSKPWFDANCFEARQTFNFIKNYMINSHIKGTFGSHTTGMFATFEN